MIAVLPQEDFACGSMRVLNLQQESVMDGTLKEEPGLEAAHPKRKSILSQGEGDRLDRWIEFLSAVVLSLATVLTAWCGYQATRWSGEQAQAYSEAGAARVQSAQYASQGLLRSSVHVALFVEYIAAISQDNHLLADFLHQRFPKELRVATDAWLATKPLKNADAPSSPFEMPEYHLAEQDQARQLDKLAAQKAAEASQANEQSDHYVLLTVLFATVLFFAGISGKFQWQMIDLAMLILSAAVLIFGLILLLSAPMR
jgi:hypothetical protein